MKKAQLQAVIEGKKGFHSIVKDDLAPDHVPGDPIEKRYFYVNHTNADGTMGKTFVYYLHDTENDVASFYNVETEALDVRELTAEQKKLELLKTYLDGEFTFSIVTGFDAKANKALAIVYIDNGDGTGTKKEAVVFKPQGQPITHFLV